MVMAAAREKKNGVPRHCGWDVCFLCFIAYTPAVTFLTNVRVFSLNTYKPQDIDDETA